MSELPPRPQMLGKREMFAWVVAGALALALIGRIAIDRRAAAPVSDDPVLAQARSAVTDLQVRDSANRLVGLAPKGVPAILMVNSKTCSFCRLGAAGHRAPAGT